jgi:hypothetical protein
MPSCIFVGCALEESRDLLADDRAHAAAHERKNEGAISDGKTSHVAKARLDAFFGLRVLLRSGHAVGVGLAVREAKGILRHQALVPRFDAAAVEKELTESTRRQLVVLSTKGAHLEALAEPFGDQGLAAAVAFAKNAFSEALFLARVETACRLFRPGHRVRS